MSRVLYWPGLVLATVLVSGCGEKAGSVAPRELEPGTACSLDGMLLLEYPGPKAQIHYADGNVEYFCDTIEMFSMLLQPEQKRRVRAVYTQDMAREEWRRPQGHWIDARRAFYVAGSKLRGSMGPTFASFARHEDAEAFAKEHGGKVLAFAEVTPAMADLRGGAQHDHRM